MSLNNVWQILEKDVFSIPSSSTLFNHYSDQVDNIELPLSSEIRKENLKNYLNSYLDIPKICLIGEAPGFRGCRFSGVPFTNEYQLCNNLLPFSGRQSSTKSKPYREQTATIFWNTLRQYFPSFFIWNCIPLHPHEEGRYLTNRTPTRIEIQNHSTILEKIMSTMTFDNVIAIGKKSKLCLDLIDISSEYVRHPSRGGSKEFKTQILKIFKN